MNLKLSFALGLALVFLISSCHGVRGEKPAEPTRVSPSPVAPPQVLPKKTVSAARPRHYPYGTPIIDAHTHLNFGDDKDVPADVKNTKEGFFDEARKIGLVGFVTHIHDEMSPIPDMAPLTGAFCAGIQEKFDLKIVEEGLKTKKFKCIKIYLGYVYRYATDSAYEPLYALAEKYSVPVVFHTGDTETSDGLVKFTDPLTIDDVAVHHRKVNIVIAHLGNPWINSAAEVIYKNPNVYGDVSALVIGEIAKKNHEGLQKLVIEPVHFAELYIENADKLMYGTDWPLVNMKRYLDVTIKAVAKEDRRKFLYENAAKIFGLRAEATP